MKNSESFTYDELHTIYLSLHDSMSIINKTDEFSEEDKEILINNLRDVAHKVMMKMERIEDENSN